MAGRRHAGLRTAVWLYLFLFVAFFDLHAQYPILTPFAVSLGAAPSFIGLMMGMYALTHLPGNLIAGYGVDRYGSRLFIVLSLLLAGIILVLQSRVTDPWQLLALRSVSGFVLAFLSPACMALLANLTRDRIMQGKLMAGNGLVHTLASVVSPAAGALLVAKIGFASAFTLLGWVLIVTALCAFVFLRDHPAVADDGPEGLPPPARAGSRAAAAGTVAEPDEGGIAGPFIWLFFLLPVAISCSQGILFFEVPLMDTSMAGVKTTGLLFSLVSIGSLLSLSMLFLNRYSPFGRTLAGCLLLALAFYGLAAPGPISFYALLLLIGIAKGIIFPAMSLVLIALSGRGRYGRMFSFFSVASSIGAFLGPLVAGHIRDQLSPYYLAFVVLMLVLAILPFHAVRAHRMDWQRQH